MNRRVWSAIGATAGVALGLAYVSPKVAYSESYRWFKRESFNQVSYSSSSGSDQAANSSSNSNSTSTESGTKPMKLSAGIAYYPKDVLRYHLMTANPHELEQKGVKVPAGHILSFDIESNSQSSAASGRAVDGSASATQVVSAGEDAFAYHVQSSASNSSNPHSALLMVVADGVGGWRNKGIDPSLFPYRLLEKVIGASIKSDETKPRNLLDEGYSNLRADPVRTIGSCTVLMGKFDAYKHTVDTAQLGDSVYAILRRRESLTSSDTDVEHGSTTLSKEQGQYSVIYQSPEQQHYFNCPHQLGIRDDEETLKKKSRWTAPSDAIEREHSLLPGDIVVLSTDGFSDNVETSELADITNAWAVKSQSVGEKNAGKLAAMLVNGAANFSLDKSKLTPFSRRSTEDGKPRQGGKMDDITVAVVMVNGSSISTSTSNSIGDSESVSPIKSKL